MEKIKETDDIVKQAQELIKKYIDYMAPLQARWIENEQWYKSRHWEYIRNQKYQGDPEPTTSFILSTIENKFADAMDHFPKAIIKPRTEGDVEEAKRLTEIIPLELEWNDFFDTWSRCWQDKLKLGPGIYAILFDPEGNNGIGSNVIKSVDPINFYCDPFAVTLDKSKGVFVTELIDVDDFERLYPDKDSSKAGKLFEPKMYIEGAKRDTKDSILIIDYYYLKTDESGRTVCHLLKFAGDEKLYWSEEDEGNADGYYKLDGYPFEIDVLYREKDNLFGFGIIDVVKSPQIYVDKLDQIILTNAFNHSRKRFFAKESAGINEQDLLDPSKTLIRANGITEDHIREWVVSPTDGGVFKHRDTKVGELKETSTANEFSRGETNSGVTAAQAIVALQKASGKTSRNMIAHSYQVFSRIIYKYVELMRQFYDIPRDYRIDDPDQEGGYRFTPYDNSGIQEQPLELMDGEEEKYRKPIFDFKIQAEKQDPFSQAADNELGKELYQLGVFNPENALQSLLLLDMMEFDKKDNVANKIKENAQIHEQLMMGQQAMMENQKLKAIVQATTGQDLGVDMSQLKGGNPQ